MRIILSFLLIILLIMSCEDVIEVDLPTAKPRLVIDASINMLSDSPNTQQIIKLSLTGPYFDSNVPAVNTAIVEISDTNNNIYVFTQNGDETGLYYNNFTPEFGEEYTLRIEYNGDVYTATEIMYPVVPVDYVEQINDGGFSGDDVEIKAFYTDPIDQENYYFFEFLDGFSSAPYLDVYDDEFTNGNQIFAFFSDSGLESGEELIIKNYGVSKRFYEYMFVLLQQGSDDSGGPFETQPATVRGNCINENESQ